MSRLEALAVGKCMVRKAIYYIPTPGFQKKKVVPNNYVSRHLRTLNSMTTTTTFKKGTFDSPGLSSGVCVGGGRGGS